METEIFWSDLDIDVQKAIAETRGKTPEEFMKEGNYDIVPLAVVDI